jgi:hypothetical protein
MVEPKPNMTRSSQDGAPEQINGGEDSTCRCHTLLCNHAEEYEGYAFWWNGGTLRDMFNLDNKVP